MPDILGLVFPIVLGFGPFMDVLELMDGFLLKAGAPGVWIVDAIYRFLSCYLLILLNVRASRACFPNLPLALDSFFANDCVPIPAFFAFAENEPLFKSACSIQCESLSALM